jgi:hypothetical protein
MEITVFSIYRAIMERPHDEWDDEPEVRQEPATIVVNHLANKRNAYRERKRIIDEEEDDDYEDLPDVPIVTRTSTKKAKEIISQIDSDVDEPVVASSGSTSSAVESEIIPLMKTVKSNTANMPPLDAKEPIPEPDLPKETVEPTVAAEPVVEPVPEPIKEKVTAMIEGLPPSAVKLAEAMGVNFNSLALSMQSGGNLSKDALIDLAVDKIGHPIMINVTEVVTFIAMFVIIAIALKFLAGVFKKANDIPLLGKLNAGLGGVIGIVKAVALLFVICTAFYFIAGMSGAKPIIDAVNSSIIYGFIIENNPIVNLIG